MRAKKMCYNLSDDDGGGRGKKSLENWIEMGNDEKIMKEGEEK